MYKRAWFKYPSEIVDFLNDNKIPKGNIVSVLVDSFGDFCLIWEEVDSIARL